MTYDWSSPEKEIKGKPKGTSSFTGSQFFLSCITMVIVSF